MILILYAAFVIGLYFLADWLFRKVAGDTYVPGRWDWRRSAFGLIALFIAAIPAWWLADVPGQIRLSRLIQAGDYSSASLAQNMPHPLVVIDGTQLVVFMVIAFMALGAHMTAWPAFWSRSAARGMGSTTVDGSAQLRFRIYGILILVMSVVGALGMAYALSRPPL